MEKVSHHPMHWFEHNHWRSQVVRFSCNCKWVCHTSLGCAITMMPENYILWWLPKNNNRSSCCKSHLAVYFKQKWYKNKISKIIITCILKILFDTSLFQSTHDSEGRHSSRLYSLAVQALIFLYNYMSVTIHWIACILYTQFLETLIVNSRFWLKFLKVIST